MKILFIVMIALVSLLSAPAQAVTVRVIGKKAKLLFEMNKRSSTPSAVGKVTVDSFEQGEVAYQGGEYGIVKIFELSNDVEVISDTEMKAYGWCFAIDGITTETMADKTAVLNSDSVIEWYYAYAHYLNGAWVSQCVRD